MASFSLNLFSSGHISCPGADASPFAAGYLVLANAPDVAPPSGVSQCFPGSFHIFRSGAG